MMLALKNGLIAEGRAKMTLTPLDIQNKEFHKGLRGYNTDEVDAFMEKVLQSYEKVYRENQELKQEHDKMFQELHRYRQLEETLNNTLITAQKAAEDLKVNAEKEAELIIREAQVKAQELLTRSSREVEQLQREYQSLQSEIAAFKARVSSLLRAQLEILEGELPEQDQSGGATEDRNII